MNKIETFHFMEKIKAYYQNFLIEDYVVNEWADKLKPYDLNDVYMKLDQHLQGEYRNEIPKLHYITRFLKPSSEKGVQKDCYCKCARCNLELHINSYSDHIGRHNAIDYIKKNAYRFDNLEVNEDLLLQKSQQEFDQLYDNIIEQLVDIVEDDSERQRLKNIIFSKAGMPIETSEVYKQIKMF